MNPYFLDTILLSSLIFFVTITLALTLSKFKQKKTIIKALSANHIAANQQLAKNEALLTSSLSSLTSPEIKQQIVDLIGKEKECYQKLANLFIDYPPAAIEMIPFIINNTINEYINCLQKVILLHQQSSEITTQNLNENEKIVDNDIDETFQYEALIEQLRYEKNDFSDKYKEARQLLNTIYLNYKDTLGIEAVDSFEKKNALEIATIFKVQMTSTQNTNT